MAAAETLQIECRACAATGLYIGFAEREGAAVACRSCRGTGAEEIAFTPFTERRRRANVTRVYPTNLGIVIAPRLGGGISYREWETDASGLAAPGTELREYTCPTWWYQFVDPSLKPDWAECGSAWGSGCTDCDSFKTKERCWERFDHEHGRPVT